MSYQGNDISGWMTPDELEWLHDTAATMDSVIELGCWKGRSTHALLTGCPGPVYAVDHWLGSADSRETSHSEALRGHLYEDFLANVCHFPNLHVVRGESPGIAAECPDADMVFIDGEHNYEAVRADIAAWRPKARKLICGHDISFPGVSQAVFEAFGRKVERPMWDLWVVWL